MVNLHTFKEKIMNKKQFLDDSEVKNFIDWLSSNFSKIEINLKIGKSKFVPSPINEKIIGIDNVLQYYKWKSSGMQSGNWSETKNRLTKLGSELRNAVEANDNEIVFQTCCKIFEWGGERNSNNGARPFIQKKFRNHSLCQYIAHTGKLFSLTTANEADLTYIEDMNAMLTKVHALYAIDGLPIYDSRVAATIGSLVELWRQDKGLSKNPLPNLLSFPTTDSKRTVRKAFETANYIPPIIRYNPKYKDKNTALWSTAKVRLGWIMQELLEKTENIFPNEDNRMHALEACLFMIGYNVSCLNAHDVDLK